MNGPGQLTGCERRGSDLSDSLGRLPVMLGGAVFCVLYPFPLFALLDTPNTTEVTR